MIKEKSLILVTIDDQNYILLMDKILIQEKNKIAAIADNLDEYNSNILGLTNSEKLDVLKHAIKNELGIEVSTMSIEQEININCKNLIPLKEQNSEEIRHFTYKGNNWFEGEIDGFSVCAKVYSESSTYGIDNGRVSKLHITDNDGKEIISYDRGWDKKPLYENKELYEEVLKELVVQRLEMNVKDQQHNKRNRNNLER